MPTGPGVGAGTGAGVDSGSGLGAGSEAGGWVFTCPDTEALGSVPRGLSCSAVGAAQVESAPNMRSAIKIAFHLLFLGFTGFRSFFFGFVGTSSNTLKINTALYRYKLKLE